MMDSRFSMGDWRFPMGDSHFPMGDWRFPTGDSHFPMGDCRFPMGDSHFPMEDCHSSVENFQIRVGISGFCGLFGRRILREWGRDRTIVVPTNKKLIP